MKKSTRAKKSQDADEEKEGVSYEKGRQFEEQFSDFMKEKLGWSKVRVGAHITGFNNAKGTSIDVLGEKVNPKAAEYKNSAWLWVAVTAGCAIFSLLFAALEVTGGVTAFGIGAIVSLIVAGNNFSNSSTYATEHAWVECKNLNAKVTINQVSKMIREFEDYKASKNDKYKFTHYYFASASGYVENALKMAEENNIICYIKKGRSFEEVKYWN